MGNAFFRPARRPEPNSIDNLGKRAYPSLVNLGKRRNMAQSKQNLIQGTLAMLILRALARGPLHGYEIAQRIQQSSEEVLKVEEGSLYPALYRMEGQGWIEAEWGASENNRRAKYYKLTRAGRKQLTVETSNWERLSQAIAKVLQTA
jgi:PadR family transcriptional regulator, regulatory protein PadR